jgi:hypothetical protein
MDRRWCISASKNLYFKKKPFDKKQKDFAGASEKNTTWICKHVRSLHIRTTLATLMTFNGFSLTEALLKLLKFLSLPFRECARKARFKWLILWN